MNYIGTEYLKTQSSSFSWNGSAWLYDGYSYYGYLEWDRSLNEPPAYTHVLVTINVDSTLTAPLQVTTDDNIPSINLDSGTPPGEYQLRLEVAGSQFNRIFFYFGYAAYRVTKVEFDEADRIDFFDISALGNYNQEESGKAIFQYNPPFTVIQPLSELFSESNNAYTIGYLYEPIDPYATGGLVVLKLFKPTLASRLRVSNSNTGLSVLLINPEGATLNLANYSYGDVWNNERYDEPAIFNGSAYTSARLSWQFDDFLVDKICLGGGGGGYPQERVYMWTKVELDAFVDTTIPPFWTNFKGQSES